MAHLVIINGNVALTLSFWERLGAFHGSPTTQLSNIESIEVIDNPWSSQYLKGFRAPGTGIPFVIMLGTLRYKGGKDFCAIYKRKPNAIVILKSGPFKRWIFEVRNPAELVSLQELLSNQK